MGCALPMRQEAKRIRHQGAPSSPRPMSLSLMQSGRDADVFCFEPSHSQALPLSRTTDRSWCIAQEIWMLYGST
eukprot:CAMPEP_0113927310 /NCGR_PEP_ID=MMETSP1159-20121227/4232_1 /TAXON_ID=88271 /ORGANISM="Picocystis salinarum" /LENGTH=73 /DNA_ID=CAMNT_0000927785 /DNA_START=313 /DNA_END=534 /DNA_ORIENTATION=+ /assembly_acc=CAM_ASM_000767